MSKLLRLNKPKKYKERISADHEHLLVKDVSSPMYVANMSRETLAKIENERKWEKFETDFRNRPNEVGEEPPPLQDTDYSIVKGDIFEPIDEDFATFRVSEVDVKSHIAYCTKARTAKFSDLLNPNLYCRTFRGAREPRLNDHGNHSLMISPLDTSFSPSSKKDGITDVQEVFSMADIVIKAERHGRFKMANGYDITTATSNTNGDIDAADQSPSGHPQQQQQSPSSPVNLPGDMDHLALANSLRSDMALLSCMPSNEDKVPFIYQQACQLLAIRPAARTVVKQLRKCIPSDRYDSLQQDTNPNPNPSSGNEYEVGAAEVVGGDKDMDDADDGSVGNQSYQSFQSHISQLSAGGASEHYQISSSYQTTAVSLDKTKGSSLSLRNLSLGNVQSCAILKSVQVLDTLQEIDLTGNRLDEAGAVAMVKSLRSVPGLQAIILDNNKIGKKGVSALMALLEQKPLDTYDELQRSRWSSLEDDNSSLGTAISSNISWISDPPLSQFQSPTRSRSGAAGHMSSAAGAAAAAPLLGLSPTASVNRLGGPGTVVSVPTSMAPSPGHRSMYTGIVPSPLQLGVAGGSASGGGGGGGSLGGGGSGGSVVSMSSIGTWNSIGSASALASIAASSSASAYQSPIRLGGGGSQMSSSYKSSSGAIKLTPLLVKNGSNGKGSCTPLSQNKNQRQGQGQPLEIFASDNSVAGRDSLSSIPDCIGAPAPALRKLFLNDNKLGDILVAKLVKCLMSTCINTLTELGLRNNQCSAKTTRSLTLLITGQLPPATGSTMRSPKGMDQKPPENTPPNCKLRFLDLGWNGFSDTAVVSMFGTPGGAAVFAVPTYLEVLLLDWNGISGKCLTLLERMILGNRTSPPSTPTPTSGTLLKHISLENNPIPYQQVQALTSMAEEVQCKVIYSSFHFEQSTFDKLVIQKPKPTRNGSVSVSSPGTRNGSVSVSSPGTRSGSVASTPSRKKR